MLCNFVAEHPLMPRRLNVVLRLRWFDSEPSGQSRSVDWRFAALTIATLFLNLHFWAYGNEVWMFCPVLPYIFIIAAGAVMITILFFVAPASMTQAMNAPLLLTVESSVGSVPALGLRFCCLCFLVLWMANSIAVPGLWWVGSILRREVSPVELSIVAVAIVAFVLITGLHSAKTTAKLALFSNKLGIAILVAAIIRVHEGLPEAVHGFPHTDNSLPEFWRGLSFLMFYAAPIGFLAGNVGYIVRSRRHLLLTAATGFALPLFGTVTMIGLTNVATVKSSFYQPSLNPNVFMALWGHAASSALPGRMLIVAVTMFGVLRFGMRLMSECVDSTAPVGVRIPWIRLSGLSLVVAWFSVHQGTAHLETALEGSTACLVTAAGVLAADWLTQRRRTMRIQRVDSVGLIALLAGLAAIPCWQALTGAEPWAHTWLLPSYAAGFLVCLLGRLAQNSRGPSLAARPLEP